MKNILTALLLSITILSFGQTTMNIYQNNGTTVNLPVSTIDSVNFTTTPPPSRMNIYQTGGGIISIVIANIDSITYTVQGASGLAVLSTMPVTNIDSTSAVSGGNVASDGGSPITQRGVVWSTTPNPTTANNNTIDGSGTGSFSSTLTGLTANTSYYVRAYATNANGTAYGNEVSFTTTAGGGGSGTYPPGTVHCTGTPTAVVDVTNPSTGKTWMDRNLGASQAATFGADAFSYGDLYQWGRAADGHQCRNSAITTILSSTDQPGHGDFIIDTAGYDDWRSPGNNNLWQGVNGVNNPCPSGYRLPTETELNAERSSWSQNNSSGAFASPLRLPVAGRRNNINGWYSNVSTTNFAYGFYWSSTVVSTFSQTLVVYNTIGNSGAGMEMHNRSGGYSVRCIKETIGTLGSLNCGGAVSTGTLMESLAASGVSSSVPYTGGNGCTHSGQIVSSTGVTGLTATLAAGTFVVGSGNLTYTISGTPTSAGTASFALNIGGQACTLTINVDSGSVFCASGPTAVVDVTNPSTGKIWMDRNLGASQAAQPGTFGVDPNSYGDLYQWGRGADGHQCRTSPTTATLSSTDQPGHGDFITVNSGNYDWRSPQNNNLWQGVNGVNNPCPSGYRLPTNAELDAERASWSQSNPIVSFASPLKLPLAGNRTLGVLSLVGSTGRYWSSTVNGTNAYYLGFTSSIAGLGNLGRANGHSVRCIKETSGTLGSLGSLNCGGAVNTGTLTESQAASGVSSSVPYTGGNGGTHSGQIVSSTGVTGLTATLAAGTFIVGSGNLTYTISGTPTSAGTASFALNIGGQSCTLTINVDVDLVSQYPSGSVFCASGPTAVVDVTNPSTGKIWMDRNLGASQVATSSTDTAAYGDLYQWGRGADGHQCRNSATTSTLSSSDQPGNSSFILAPNQPFDWRSPQNDNLWQGVNGVNNPCPSGYRLPTFAELDAESASWSQNNSAGAFASQLKLPMAGYRSYFASSGYGGGVSGYYWSSAVNGTGADYLFFNSSGASMSIYLSRAFGVSVRCLKD